MTPFQLQFPAFELLPGFQTIFFLTMTGTDSVDEAARAYAKEYLARQAWKLLDVTDPLFEKCLVAFSVHLPHFQQDETTPGNFVPTGFDLPPFSLRVLLTKPIPHVLH